MAKELMSALGSGEVAGENPVGTCQRIKHMVKIAQIGRSAIQSNPHMINRGGRSPSIMMRKLSKRSEPHGSNSL